MSDVKLSKTLSYVLRHHAPEMQFTLLPGGYVPVSELLAHPMFKNYTLNDVERVVCENQKKRFSIKEDSERGKLIAANQGHSFTVEEPELVPISDPALYRVVVHGTYFKAWENIQKEGLKRMNRTHIHFAKGEPRDSEVISGMRGSCELMIFINLQKAMTDGIPFFISKNDVILSPGDSSGCIPVTYFSEVIQRRPRRRIEFAPPQ
ncbi:tRNA 2'-phosphotransferase 1 [Holothuria leucospilota]|uniref:2'-phosphotransferase n=1 Tax=Holothuria leucospilota TaxID=206669 RepID=A0A9Q1HHF4_HOLLE|nr:tRNA 2'-phosphotransferase 1 [Holothuria leucospilota]